MEINRHDTIVTFVAGKMQKIGFKIKFMEGSHADVTDYKPELPPKLVNHRPDAFGVKIDGSICIGEAKTASDLGTERTRLQMLDFKNIVRENPGNLLIIGIPQSAKKDLLALLNKLGIIINDQISIMEIPETLLPPK